ncbi:MAG: hypothetical protein KAQ87_03615 [Candidatus Pacebacteria bacterium]|nr:hypothetical protein [Candidatus Paceibacterota bacterium]
MNKKIAQGSWLIIVTLFISMEIYHLSVGNYDDLIISGLIVIIPLLAFAMYYLIKKRDKK